jgi:hypothetical protein
MRQNSYNPKIFFRDQQGAEIAYSYDGKVHATAGGHHIGTLRGGNVYSTDGQLLGRLTPNGTVRREDGSVSEAFLRLAANRMTDAD